MNKNERYAYIIFHSPLWQEPNKVWAFLDEEAAIKFIKKSLVWDNSFIESKIDDETICWTSQKFKKHIQLTKIKLIY